MENSFEQLNKIESEAKTAKKSDSNILEQMHNDALLGESYEDAAAALESVEAIQGFREKLRGLPFNSFYEVIEEATNINRLRLSGEEREEKIEALAGVMEEGMGRFSPRVADLYAGMLAELKKEEYEYKFKEVKELMADLKKPGAERQTSDLAVLFSPEQSWEIKLNRINTRLLDNLKGFRALDRREGRVMDDDIREWREEEIKKAPVNPPERRNESKPGVDPMERLKEGERAPAIWSIYPAYGGYYKEQSFSKWDSKRNVWTESEYFYSDVEYIPICEKENPKKGLINLTMNTKSVAGRWVSLPVPYTHDLHKIEAGGRNYSARKDQNGDLVIYVEGNRSEAVEIKVVLAPNPEKKFKQAEKPKVPDMPAEFSSETDNKLKETISKRKGNIMRARALASYARSRIKYLAPKDYKESTKYNNAYNSHKNGFAGAVDELKQADCDVANTYFAALCAKLNIPVRHCVGHSVRGKDSVGASSINSGTGHGWSEVWDEKENEWIRIDATPPGDRQLEDWEEKEGGESVHGDYGEQEAAAPTEEELEDLRRKLAERKTELSYTKEERQLAEAAGVELKEARQIVKEINEAERTRLPNGELVVDALARVFNAIVESRKTTVSEYDGPVRKSEGGEAISEIVRHKIGILAGDSDPVSREKPSEEIKEEKLLGGFDLYMIGDKSGSMRSSVDGETLWKMQRRAEYLIFFSLRRFEKNIERAGLQKENDLSARTQGISFRGSGPEDIDLDKELSSNFTAKEKVKLWHSLTEQGMANGDVASLSYIYEQIEGEIKNIEKSGVKDNRLRIIIACSDGGPDDAAGVQMLAEKLSRLNAVVVGMGLTETATSVPIIYNTPYSRGDIARDINDLPALVAKHVVLEAIKLFPEKARETARNILDDIISKFKNI